VACIQRWENSGGRAIAAGTRRAAGSPRALYRARPTVRPQVVP
jgi:hypothetical protein